MKGQRVALTVAVLALVAALGGVGGAVAGTALIGSKQIKNGSVKSIDLKNDGVQSADLAANSVEGEALAPASVEGEVLALPEPTECQVTGATTIRPGTAFEKLADICTANKVEATSALEVTWSGTAEGHNGGEASGCVFQLRVNGQPSAQGGGETFVKGTGAASATALFTGLGSGPVTVELWARLVNPASNMNPTSDICTLGPASAGGVMQTVDVSEAVV